MRTLLTVLVLLVLGNGVLAQRDAKIPNPDPEVERKTFKVAEGFEVNLFAADPMLAKPIHMNFDASGRLWIASSETYPQIKPGQKANDRILILEDTKGVGKADKVTVFADGLLIPTGLEPGDGGVYVANSTELVHLSASKPGLKADRRKVILSGFGTEDTHHMLHTLRWGPDGNLYMNQSVYIHSHIETPHGVRRLNAGGVWQFRPDTLRLEVFARGLWNTWGHHFDRYGTSFLTDGAGGQGIYYGFNGAAYDPIPGVSRTLQGLNPGSPKYCGLEIVGGSHLPDDWQGSLITCDFRAHRVCRFTVTPSGSGFTSRLMADVIKGSHPAFRPIDVKQGPDGAIYIADWYNPIIQHGEVDFRDPRRDVTHGRIWRVTAKGRKLAERPKLVGATSENLVKQLASPEPFTRHFARRQLKEAYGEKALADLKKWISSLHSTEPETESRLLEGLWTYQTLDVVEPKLLARLLDARDHRVRAAAVRVLGLWQDRVDGAASFLERRVVDEHPQVRLEAIRALSLLGGQRGAEIAVRALDKPLDMYLDYALGLTLRETESAWLTALQDGKFDYSGIAGRLSYALQAIGSEKVVKQLVGLLSSKLKEGEEEEVQVLLARIGGPTELDLLLQQLTGKVGKQSQRARLLGAMEESARLRNVRPKGRLDVLVELVQQKESESATRLVGLWKVEEARKPLTELALEKTARPTLRHAAIEGLALLGGGASKTTLEKLADTNSEVQREALIALVLLDTTSAAKHAVKVLATSKDPTTSEPIYTAFLTQKDGAAALSKALSGQKLPGEVARIGVRTIRVSGREAPTLLDALTKAGGLKSGPKVLSGAELREMVADVATKGDPVRGERLFRRSDLLCMRCHAIGGAGGQVGPDISSIGAAAQVDYLIESLLQPSKAIKEGYHALLVTTNRGQQYTGIKVRETPSALVLRSDQDTEITIPVRTIEERAASKTSLMPEGLTDTLTRGEFLDLVRFLSELGKAERWSVGRARVARRWEALMPGREAYTIYFRQGVAELAGLTGTQEGVSFEPAYSDVSGMLPLEGLPKLTPGKNSVGLAVVQTRLEVSTASKFKLRLGNIKGLSAWLNGDTLTLSETVTLDLKPGTYKLTLSIDLAQRKEGLRIEAEDGPGASAVRFVVGK